MAAQTPQKQYIVQRQGFPKADVWDEEKFNRSKDRFFNDFKEDGIAYEMAPLTQDYKIQDNDTFVVHRKGYPKADVWDAEKMRRSGQRFLKDFPDAEITRATPIDYWGDKLNEIYNRMGALEEELKGLPSAADNDISDLRNMSDEDLMQRAYTTKATGAAGARRREINRELDQLRTMREQNPAWQRYWKAQNDEIDQSLARVEGLKQQDKQRQIGSAKDWLFSQFDNEYLRAAESFYNDAKKVVNAPSKYSGEEGLANIGSGIANFWQGVKDTGWSAISFVDLAKQMNNVNLLVSIQKIQKNEGNDVNVLDLVNNHPERLSYMSDAEREMMKAFVRKAEVEGGRSETLSRMYQAGQGAAKSLAFMADFALAGGIGNAAAETVAGELVKNAGRNAAKKIAADTLYGTVKALAMTPFMPSTYSNFIQNLTQLNDAGGVDLSGKKIAQSIGDVLIENVSETVGSKPLDVIGLPLSKVKFPAWAKAMRHSPIAGALKQAGYNGLFEEMVEEWTGNAMRSITGVDKDALKNYANWDQQLITLASFAPMSLLNGSISAVQYYTASKAMRDAGTALSDVLKKNGIDADLSSLRNYETPEELAHQLSWLYKQVVEKGGDAQEALRAVMKYDEALSRYNVMDGVFEEQKDIDRSRRLVEINNQLGNENWYHTGENGSSYVRTITDADGRENFVLANNEDGLALVDSEGKKTILGQDALAQGVADGSLQDSGEVNLSDYLDNRTEVVHRAQEAERMQEESAQNNRALFQQAQPGVNIGTEDEPEIILQYGGGVFITQKGNEVKQYSQEEMANKLGIRLTPESEAEIEAKQEALDEHRTQLRDYLREKRGTPFIGPDGRQLTIVGAIRGRGEEKTPFFVFAKDENGRDVTLPYGDEDMDTLVAAISGTSAEASTTESEPAPAPAEPTVAVEDNVPRDFRGNPLPMRTNKQTGQQVVDGNILWERDPEAWARWNDTNPNQRVGSRERLEYTIGELGKEIDKDTKAIQKAALKGTDEDEMDKMEQGLASKNERRNLLLSILNKYNLPATPSQTIAGEQRQAAAEQTIAEQQAGFPGIQQRWSAAPKVAGSADEIRLANGETLTGHYVLTEADAPTASHNPEKGYQMSEGFPVDENGRTVNDRDYERDEAAQKSVTDKAANYDQRALQTPVIVTGDGVVLSGNDRTMASQMAARQGTDKAYTDYLAKYPQKYGFTPEQVGQFQHPRVVFVPDTAMPYDAATFAKFNAEDKKSQNKTEKAVKAGKTLTPETIGALATLVDRYEDVNALYNDPAGVQELIDTLVASGTITAEQKAALKDGDLLSGAGMDLLESTLLGAALEEDAVRIAMSDKSIRKSIVTAIAQIIRGNTLEGYNLRAELTDAIALVANGKSSGAVKFGESLQGYVRQGNLFGGDVLAEATVQLLADAINNRKITLLKRTMQGYLSEAVEASQGQLSFFSKNVLTREQILTEILTNLGYDIRTFNTEPAAAEPAGAATETGEAGDALQSDEPGAVTQQDREEVAARLEEGNVGEYRLAESMTDEEIAEFLRLWAQYEPSQDALGEAYSELDADLKSSNKKVKAAAEKRIRELTDAQIEAFAPVQEFVNGLLDKYPIDTEVTDVVQSAPETQAPAQPIATEEDTKKTASKKPASEKKVQEQTYTQEEYEDFIYGNSFGTEYTSKRLGWRIQILSIGDKLGFDQPNTMMWVWKSPDAKQGDRVENTAPTDYVIKFLKANGFKRTGKPAKKNKYGYYINPVGVVMNPLVLGGKGGNEVRLYQGDDGLWRMSTSYLTNMSGGGSPLTPEARDKYKTKSEAIKAGIKELENTIAKHSNENTKELEAVVRELKSKALPQALLEEGVVESVPRAEITASELDNGVQGDLFGGEVEPERYSVSNQSAEKGGNFYQNEYGEIDLVKIGKEVTDKMKVANVPLRLTTSMVKHIYEQHKKEGKFKTEQDAIQFVIDVMTNFDHVRDGGKGTYVFSVENGRKNTGRRAITIILHSSSGEYFGVKTSGYERIEDIQKRPLIWEKGVETSATDTASANVTSDSLQQGGEMAGNASNQTNGLSEDKDTEISEETSDYEEISDVVELEDEEGTPGNYHWVSERVCTNPTIITVPGADKRGRVSKIALAEKDGQWYVASFVTADGGKGSSWGSQIPAFRGSYIPYPSRYVAVQKAVDGLRWLLSDPAKKQQLAVGETYNETKALIDYLVKMELEQPKPEDTRVYDLKEAVAHYNFAKGGAKNRVFSQLVKSAGEMIGFADDDLNDALKDAAKKFRAEQVSDGLDKAKEQYIRRIRQAVGEDVQEEAVQEAAPAQPEPAAPAYGSQNTIITTDKYEELKRRMKEKLGQLNAGFDPEIFYIGAQMAVYHVEAGARKFVDFAQRMISELGDAIRPYLKAIYNGARDLPGMEGLRTEMDSAADVDAIDVDAISTAEQQPAEEEPQQIELPADAPVSDEAARYPTLETWVEDLAKNYPAELPTEDRGKFITFFEGLFDYSIHKHDVGSGNRTNHYAEIRTIFPRQKFGFWKWFNQLEEIAKPQTYQNAGNNENVSGFDYFDKPTNTLYNLQLVSDNHGGGTVLRIGYETYNTPESAQPTATVREVNAEDLLGGISELMSGRRDEVRLSDYATEIQQAREEVDTNPTDAQKEAGNYKKGHITVDGYEISIENPKGSIRSGKDASGNEWSVTMNNDYGYIRMTEGVDGDHIDVFLSDNPTQGNVFVVDQIKKDGSFDEHKVMYGFPDAEAARIAYLANYSPGWKGLGKLTEVSRDEFKKWVNSSHRKTKPFSEYSSVKTEGDVYEEAWAVGELGKYTHTKTGKEMTIVRLTGERLSMDEFKQLKARAKEFGGYYSSFGSAKGFLFDNEEDAIKFNTINTSDNAEEQTDEQTAADTAAIVSEAASVASEAQSLAEAETPAEPAEIDRTVATIDETLDVIDDQLALLGYYEAEQDGPFNEMYGYMKSAEKKAVKDADRLAKKLAADLGIEVGRKALAKANIAPAGGEVRFVLPLPVPKKGTSDYQNLVVDIHLEPDENNFDNLRIGDGWGKNLAIMFRIEDTGQMGLARYGQNHFAPYNVTYSELLRAIRFHVKDYLREQAEQPAGSIDLVELAQEQAEKNKKSGKSGKKSVSSQEDGNALLGGLFADLDTEEQEAPIEESEAPAASVKPTEVNGFARNEKVLYTDYSGKTQEATIYDFEYDNRPVLDTGFAPVMYEVVEWSQIKKLETEPVNDTDNGLQRNDGLRTEGLQADNNRPVSGAQEATGGSSAEAEQESGRTDAGREGGSDLDTGSGRSLRRIPRLSGQNTHNNRIAKGEVVYPKTPAARFKANVAAIRLLKELQDSGKNANKAQMSVLRQYTGWGGLGVYFNNEYSPEHRELRSLLTDEEMQAAALSINTAYYTPVEVIDSMWDIAKRLGFEGGNVLEGSAGIGNILASMPKGISEHSAITAVELDNITGGILELLYPDAQVMIKGFEEAEIPNNSIDLAITNVPFGDNIKVYDPKEKDLTRKFGGKIHDFCIAKNVRKLRDGGIGIFISTRGTLDASNKALRQWIVNEGGADVIGAFRLNNATFEGTGATSDIIVVRKRVNGKAYPNAINVSDTQITRRETVPTNQTEWNKNTRSYEPITIRAAMEINSYFVEHPENMGGEMSFGYEHNDSYRPASVALWPKEGVDQMKRLAKWVKHFAAEQTEPVATDVETGTPENEDTTTKEGQLITNSKGDICISRSGKAVPLGVNAQKIRGKYTKAQALADYDALKTAINETLDYQLKNESDEGLKPLLTKLNRAYDGFVRNYGNLNRNTAISFLRNDVDFPSIAAVEDYKEKKDINGKVRVEVKKTSIFNGRVLGAKRTPTPATAKDGVIVSINQFGRIDLPFIARALGKDEDSIRTEILTSGLGFENPLTGELEVEYEYLSGNVREKLEYAREHNGDGRYNKNIAALEKVIPADIPAHLIEFSLGSDWLPVELYTEYAKEKFGVTDEFVPTYLGGSWVIPENEWGMGVNTEKNRAAGVHSESLRMDKKGHELFVAAMNNTSVVFSRTYRDNVTGETHTETDKVATQAATTKMSEMREDFKEWCRAKMLEKPELSERIGKIYNDTFNAIVPKQIKDTFIPEHFEGQVLTMGNKPFHLYPHQAKAVIRATTEPLMMAHEVGAGKTFALITTAMEMRRLGTAKKPMIVVQNATLGQFVSSAKELYPNAKVLTISEADRTVEGRSAFYAKIKYNDWDIIIVPQSVFEMMPDSEERQRAFIQEKIDEKKFILEQAKAAKNSSAERQLKKELEDLEYEYQYGEKPKKGNGSKKDAKKEAEAISNAAAKAKKQLDRRTDEVSDFDDMGIDALLVDEAHSYKHLGFSTAMQRGVKGVDATGSKKSAGVYLKTRAVFDKVGWKNVVFATGTPISNTAAEIWTFMKYLMPADMMRQHHIYYFDDFVRNFGNIAQSLEFTTSGKFKENTRFASYTNLPELIRIWSAVTDTVLAKDAAAAKTAEGKEEKLEDKLPKMEGGQAKDIYLPQSPSLVDIMTAIRARLEWYEGLTGKEKKENSSVPLVMFGLAKMAAIDPRLVDKNAPDEPNSKTNRAVQETLRALEDSKEYKGTCALFSDNFRRWDTDENGKRSEGFNIFEEIKRKLIEAGVPEDQIVIMKSGMTTAAKEKIFSRVNAGDVRVIMGTTATLGTGVNIQERLFFEAHLDAPNRPMDYTQRMGRILRQGNLHKDWGIPVRVVRFGVEDSLDVTAYQRLSTKSKFINSVMDGKPLLENGMSNRVLEEEEEGEFDNPVAVLSGSQYALLKSQAERELRKLRNKKEQHRQDQIYIERTLKENKNRLAYDEKLIEEARGNLAKAKAAFPDGAVKEISIEGRKAKGAEQIAETIKEKITGPLRERLERQRNNRGYSGEQLKYNITFDGVPVDVNVFVERLSEWNERARDFRTVMRTRLEYSCPQLGISERFIAGGYANIKDVVTDFTERIATGAYFETSIANISNTIARLNADNDLMLQRRGKPFAEEDKLAEQEKVVEDYTEKMKAEMAEKEAKYAEAAKNAKTSFTLDNVEIDEDEDGDGETSAEYSDMDGNGYFSGIEDRRDGEDANTFTERVVAEVTANYPFLRGKIISISLPSLSVEKQALLPNGQYNRKDKKITIFAKENRDSADGIERTIMHEAIHMLIHDFGWHKDRQFINLFNTALILSGYYSPEEYQEVFANVKATYEESSGREYTSAEIREEMVTHELSQFMLSGLANEFIVGAKEFIPELGAQLEKLVNTLGYEPRKESESRMDAEVLQEYREQRIIAARQRNAERRSVGDSGSESVLRDGAATGERSGEGDVQGTGSEGADLDEYETSRDGIIYSASFKKWFGDWENNPDAASKVVDDEGKPLVVEHATNNDFTEFDITHLGENSHDKGLFGAGFYFGTHAPGWMRGSKNLLRVFLDIKNPFEIPDTVSGKRSNFYGFLVEKFDIPALRSLKLTQYGRSINFGDYLDIIKSVNAEIAQGLHDEDLAKDEEIQATYRPEDRMEVYRDRLISERAGHFGTPANSMGFIIGEVIGSEAFTKALKESGYDGVIVNRGSDYNEYVAFEPTQIKSATDNNGDFNPDNTDIRFREGGEYSPSPVNYAESMGAKRLAANQTATKCGVDIEFKPSKEMMFRDKPLAGRWVNGKMYICLEHCRDNDDAVRTVLHEGVGHNGLRKLIGNENMREFCLDMFSKLPVSARREIADAAVNKYGANIAEAVEEYLAEKAEVMDFENEDYERGFWDIVRDGLRRVLAKIGINIPLSQRDVRWLMWQSYNANKQGDLLNEAKRNVVANKLGFTLRQQADRVATEQASRNRLAEENLAPAARIYNKDVLHWASRLRETWVDKDDSVQRLVGAIEKATGKKAESFEDVRLALNQQSSKGLAAIEEFERKYWVPLKESIKKLMGDKGCDLSDIERYVMIKHGLERNEVFARRDAREFYQDAHDSAVASIEKALEDGKIDSSARDMFVAKEDAKLEKNLKAVEAGTDVKYKEFRKQDYGGLTAMYSEYDAFEPYLEGVESWEEYQARVLQARHPKYTYIDELGKERVDMAATEAAAQKEVEEFEAGFQTGVDELWERINAATKATLKHQYDANMIGRNQYIQMRDMFNYYVPLRGFADNTAEDMYDYYRSDQRNDFTPPLLKAKGRKTESESPFGYIGAMASSGIAADMKNETKLALYYFVSNRAANDLVTISEVWYKVTGSDELGRKVFSPVYPPLTEDLGREEAKRAYEDWEKQMEEEAKAGLAFKGSRKLNLHNSVIHIDKNQTASHVIKFKVGGRDMMMYINGNPRAAQAINNELNVEMSADYQKVFGKVLRWFSGINTSYNPEFWLSNAQRDALFAIMSVDIKEDSEYGRAFRKNFGSLLAKTLTPGARIGAFKLLRKLEDGTLGDSGMEALYREFVENGGVTGYTTLKNNEEWEQELRKYTGRELQTLKSVKSVFESVQKYGEAIEQMTRFAAYMTSRGQGKDIKDAVNDAKELTVNFNRKGSGKAISWKEADRLRTKDGKKLKPVYKALVVGASWLPVYGRRFIMFFNASTQGLNAMYRLFKSNPGRTGIWAAGFLALGVLQAVIHALMDDDDDYLDIPDYERRNNLLLGGKGVYLKWALPQETHVFYAIGDMAVNHALGREPHKKLLSEIAASALDVAPLNPSGGLSALAPSALAPVVEVIQNRDYKGAKIYNDLRYLSDEERKRTPGYQKAYQSTAKRYVLISQFANWATGGDYADAGWLNINPAIVEHLVEGATGGAGTTVKKVFDTVENTLSGEFQVISTPFIRRLLTNTDDRYRNAHTTELFDFYKAEAEHTKKRIKTYQKDGDIDKLNELMGSDDYEIMHIYDSYKGIMKYYNDELKYTDDKKERKALMREQDEVRKEMIMEISNIGKK